MKRIAFLVFGILMLMTVMTACGKSKEEKLIVGTWRYEGSEYVSVITFNEDMTCTETVTASINSFNIENTKNGTYEINKETLMIYFDNKLDHLANFRLENDKMIWESILDDVVYVRVN